MISLSSTTPEEKEKAAPTSTSSTSVTSRPTSPSSKVASPPPPVQSSDQGKEIGSNGDRSIAGDADQDSSASSQSTAADKKGKKILVRSEAVRDESSPPPRPPSKEPAPAPDPHMLTVQASTHHTHGKGNPLKNQGSGSTEGSFSSLSRDSSTENYTDSTGIDLEKFIKDTLQTNPKDRILLLKLEQEFLSLINDPKREIHKFERMTSYHRMYVHRVAAFFGLDHNIDPSGTSVIVQKTPSTRIPHFKFSDYGSSSELTLDEPKKSILKRDSSSFEDTSGISMGSGSKDKSPDRYAYGGSGSIGDNIRSKSLEEREEQYQRTKARIFGGSHEGGPSFGRSKSEDQAPGHRYDPKSHPRGPKGPYRSPSFPFPGHSQQNFPHRKQQSFHVSNDPNRLAAQFGTLTMGGPSPSGVIFSPGQPGQGPMDLKDVSQGVGYGVPYGYGISSPRGMPPVNSIPLTPAIPIPPMPLCYYPAPQPAPSSAGYPPGMILSQPQVIVASSAPLPSQRAPNPYASGSPNKQGYATQSPQNTPPPPGQIVSTSASYNPASVLGPGSVISTHPHTHQMTIGYATTGGAPSSSCHNLDPSNAPQSQSQHPGQYMQGAPAGGMQLYHPHQQPPPYSYMSSQSLTTVTTSAHMGATHQGQLNGHGMGSSGSNGGGSDHASHLIHMGQISPVNQYGIPSNQYTQATNQPSYHALSNHQSYHALVGGQTHGAGQQHQSLDSPSHTYSSSMSAGQSASSHDQSYSPGSVPSSSASANATATIVGYGVLPGTVLPGAVVIAPHQMSMAGRQGGVGQPISGLQMPPVSQGLSIGDASQGGSQTNGVSMGQQQGSSAMGSASGTAASGSMTPNRMPQAQHIVSTSGLPVGMSLGQAPPGGPMPAPPLLPSPGTQYHPQSYSTHPLPHQASLSSESPYMSCGYYNLATGQITLEPPVQSQQQQGPQAQQQQLASSSSSSSSVTVAQGSVSCPDNRYYNPMGSVNSPPSQGQGTPSKTPRGKLTRSKKSK